MFKLELKTANAAFRDDTDIENTDTGARNIEVARILRRVAEQLENDADGGVCIDVNGNTVGRFYFT